MSSILGRPHDRNHRSIRAVKIDGLLKGPKPIAAYLRCHPSKQHHRQAISVLEGVRILEDGKTVKVRGVGTLTLEDAVHKPIRSAQIVLRKGQLWLHAQHGEIIPEPKDLDGRTVGYDSGVLHTLTSSKGEHLHRPDTLALQERVRNIYRHRRKCCTYQSRQWRRLGKKARTILNAVAHIQQNWERHTARDISEEHSLVGLENLQLKSMTASAKGTSSLPGSGTKRALNEKLARARIGRLHHAIMRRSVRDGTWLVMVNPANTSLQCSRCGEKDKEGRDAEQFTCTSCGFAIHADENAGRNIRTRAENVMRGYRKTRGGRDECPGSDAPNRQGLHEGHGRQLRSCFTRGRRAPLARSVDLARGLDVLTAVLSSHQYNSQKHPAKRPITSNRPFAARRSTVPPSDDMRPPSNLPMTSRRPRF